MQKGSKYLLLLNSLTAKLKSLQLRKSSLWVFIPYMMKILHIKISVASYKMAYKHTTCLLINVSVAWRLKLKKYMQLKLTFQISNEVYNYINILNDRNEKKWAQATNLRRASMVGIPPICRISLLASGLVHMWIRHCTTGRRRFTLSQCSWLSRIGIPWCSCTESWHRRSWHRRWSSLAASLGKMATN